MVSMDDSSERDKKKQQPRSAAKSWLNYAASAASQRTATSRPKAASTHRRSPIRTTSNKASKSWHVRMPKRMIGTVAAIFLILPLTMFMWKETHLSEQEHHEEHAAKQMAHNHREASRHAVTWMEDAEKEASNEHLLDDAEQQQQQSQSSADKAAAAAVAKSNTTSLIISANDQNNNKSEQEAQNESHLPGGTLKKNHTKQQSQPDFELPNHAELIEDDASDPAKEASEGSNDGAGGDNLPLAVPENSDEEEEGFIDTQKAEDDGGGDDNSIVENQKDESVADENEEQGEDEAETETQESKQQQGEDAAAAEQAVEPEANLHEDEAEADAHQAEADAHQADARLDQDMHQAEMERWRRQRRRLSLRHGYASNLRHFKNHTTTTSSITTTTTNTTARVSWRSPWWWFHSKNSTASLSSRR